MKYWFREKKTKKEMRIMQRREIKYKIKMQKKRKDVDTKRKKTTPESSITQHLSKIKDIRIILSINFFELIRIFCPSILNQ
jgi:hypothetical protein